MIGDKRTRRSKQGIRVPLLLCRRRTDVTRRTDDEADGAVELLLFIIINVK